LITRVEIENRLSEYGESWAYPHVARVLALAERIAGTLEYQPECFWYAAVLHDWGAFPKYRQAGIEHAIRSRQIAEEEILPYTGFAPAEIAIILEAIELHDYRDPRPVFSAEALLLREADFLDFLGAVGIAREFAWGPNNVALVVKRIRTRITGIQGRFTLPAAQEIAAQRIDVMNQYLSCLELESSGIL
jgi:uncharacterized protein